MVLSVQLDKSDHFGKMMHSLKQMTQDGDYCDFKIIVNDQKIQAHKNILAAESLYFKAMLKPHTKEVEDGIVEMKDVDGECVQNCIDFIYSGKLDIPDGKKRPLLDATVMMQLDEIKDAICNILQTNLKLENFYETKDIAETYHLQVLASKCEQFYMNNLMAISSQPEFRNEKKSDLLHALKSKNFKLSEEDKMTLSLRWVRENSEESDVLLEFIKLIKICEVSHQYLNDLLEDHPVISNDLRLYKMISSPLLRSYRKSSMTNCSNQKDKNNEGRIVLFDSRRDCLLSYDPVTDKVTMFRDIKFKYLISFTTISLDGFIYVFGDSKSIRRLELKNGNAKWERMPDMIFDHGIFPPFVTLSGSIFVIGSRVSGPGPIATKVIEQFNPALKKWKKLNDMPSAILNHTLVSLGGSIYRIGGILGGQCIPNLTIFTPSSSKWTDLAPMKIARRHCGAAVYELRIFVMGGYQMSSQRICNTECYEITSGQWSCLSPMIGRISCRVLHCWNGCILLVGNEDRSGVIIKYDIARNRWHTVELKGNFQTYESVSFQG